MKSPKPLQLLRDTLEPESWEFVFPVCVRDFDEVYDKIQDNWDYTDSKPSSQIAELESLIERCPDYLDAYNLLAIIIENTGNLDLSIQVWERGFDLIRMAIPPEFDFDKHQINYYVLSNRPFVFVKWVEFECDKPNC
jgi:hypothetical protein